MHVYVYVFVSISVHVVMERLGVGDEKRQSSTLRSVRSMVTRVYPTLEEDQLSPLIPADLVLALVEPFTAHIHHKFTSSTVSRGCVSISQSQLCCCRSNCRHSGLLYRQSVFPCQFSLSLSHSVMVELFIHHRLLTLLGQPLVAHDLREGSESRRTAEAIMVGSSPEGVC